jgi:putative redox protein
MREHIEQVWFAGSGGDRLSARLDRPRDEPVAYALFVHCFTCSKEIPAATRIARGLVDRGIGVLRFDFTGLGASEGEFANTNFSSNIDDVVRAADMLRHRYEAPKILVGHSLGGAAALAAAAQVPEAVAVVTIGAPFDLAQLARTLTVAAPALEREEEVSVEIGGRRFPIRRQLIEDVNAQNLTGAISTLGRALLVFHAPQDEIVDIDNARRIFDTAKHPKSFVSLDNADHLLTRGSDAAYVAQVLAAWAGRYLDAPPRERAIASEGVVIVRGSPRGELAQDIRAGGHALIADEPEGVGDDLGPTPYDLLLASLGACTAMTLRVYARRKGWPLEDVSVRLVHDRVHADDSRDCTKLPCRIDRIETIVSLAGPLTDEQRHRLVEIAERCPVHRTLMADKQIVTRLDVGSSVPDATASEGFDTAPATDAADYDALLARGRCHRLGGAYPEAIADFTRAHAVRPGAARPLFERGAILILLGHYDESRADYEAAIAREPGYPGAVSYLAELDLYTGRADEALARSERASRNEPANLVHRVNIAHAHLLLGHAERAAEAYDAIAEERDPGKRMTGAAIALADLSLLRAAGIHPPEMLGIEQRLRTSTPARS